MRSPSIVKCSVKVSSAECRPSVNHVPELIPGRGHQSRESGEYIPARREPNPVRVLSSRAGVVIPGRVVNPAAGVNPGWLVAHPSEQNWVLHQHSWNSPAFFLLGFLSTRPGEQCSGSHPGAIFPWVGRGASRSALVPGVTGCELATYRSYLGLSDPLTPHTSLSPF